MPILSQMDPVYTTPSYFSKIYLTLLSHICLYFPSDLFPYGFPTKPLYAFLFSPMHATFCIHLTFPDLITLIIFSKEYKLCCSSLCSFLQPPITSALSLASCSQIPSVHVLPLMSETQFHTYTKLQAKL
jgi:hypothetical protein